MAKTMQAVQYLSYGGGASALKHVEVAVPKPKRNQVLVKVEAASMNPVDWRIQDGWMRHILPPKFPHIPGINIAGVVVSVGPGVTTFMPGDKIISLMEVKDGGGLAEYATPYIDTTAKRPPAISAVDGSCLGVAGLAALQSLRDSAGLKLDGSDSKPMNILITGASGGVGTFAVQIAKLGGAHVTATCGARNIELIKSLGADEVLDYETPEGAKLVSSSGKKYDAIINCAHCLPFAHFKPLLAPTGNVIDVCMSPNAAHSPKGLLKTATQLVRFSKQLYIPFYMMGNTTDIYYLINLMKQGKLRVVVDSKHPLAKAEEAWAASMNGHATGKIVVTMEDSS